MFYILAGGFCRSFPLPTLVWRVSRKQFLSLEYVLIMAFKSKVTYLLVSSLIFLIDLF